jgi:hypothetical protein
MAVSAVLRVDDALKELVASAGEISRVEAGAPEYAAQT